MADATKVTYAEVVAVLCDTYGDDGEWDGGYCVWYAVISKCFVRPNWDNSKSCVDTFTGLMLGADSVALSDPKAFMVVTWFQRLCNKNSETQDISALWLPKMQNHLGGKGTVGTAKRDRVSVFQRLDFNPYGRNRRGSEVKATDVISRVRMLRWAIKAHEDKGDLFVLSREDEEAVSAKQQILSAQRTKDRRGKIANALSVKGKAKQ